MSDGSRLRRLIQFRLRTLLIAMAITGAGTAYLVNLLRWSSARRAFLAQPGVADFSQTRLKRYPTRPRAPGGLALLGETGVDILLVPFDRYAPPAKELFPEAEVRVEGFLANRLLNPKPLPATGKHSLRD